MALGLAGVAARIWLWWFSIGSNDTVLWSIHARHVLTQGLAYTYRSFQEFNHPPLMGLYAAQAWLWGAGDLWQFARWMKLPGLAGEALTMGALWRFSGHRAFAAYAMLPAAILVSGFHGNTDCLYAAFVLVAAIAFDTERFLLSGLLWSAALNVKLLPLVLIPMVFLGVPNLKAFARLCFGFAIGMLPFLPPAFSAGPAMYRNILTYNSLADNWGIMALLNQGVASPLVAGLAAPLRVFWIAGGRYIILLAILAVAMLSRVSGRTPPGRIPMTVQAALGSVLFLILTPGFGVQYVAFAAPLLCMVDLPEGILWGCLSGVFIGAVYLIFGVSSMPLQSTIRGWYPEAPTILGMLAWTVLLHFTWTHTRVYAGRVA